ncbi:hypothetical protein ABEB36_011751 [Hypothenemus hampei]|uniref:Uncharacterized protein n=1 Tax=Hypothenemus hampei TaxID=57062 RepID=A0ABD1E8X0_HYPHA
MRFFYCVVLFLVAVQVRAQEGNYVSAHYYCKNLHRQQIVDVTQLGGIWYLIEKIFHNEERHLTVNLTTCPNVYITEEQEDRLTTYSPYGTTYGSNYPHMRNPISEQDDYLRKQQEYDRKTTYDYERRSGINYFKRYFMMKHLRIDTSESNGGSSEQHHLRYNTSDPGFWKLSSAPDEGIHEQQYLGTIQVVKAVGNHLVLTKCRPSYKELYTMILSRENYLDSWDIHNVHSFLSRQGLNMHFVQKTCNSSSGLVGLSLFVLWALIVTQMFL